MPDTHFPASSLTSQPAAAVMLAALRRVSRVCGPAEHWNGETHEMLREVEAAIAKAEGRP